MNRTLLLLGALGATLLSTAACSSGDVPVGTSTAEQKLQKGKNGGPTGDGKTCSWDQPVSSDGTSGYNPDAPAAPAAALYQVGDAFTAPDGCNSCTCTDRGIACTEKACSAPPGQGCDTMAHTCPDGTIAKQGPSCEIVCPPTGPSQPCPAIQRICNDGSNAQPQKNTCDQWCPEDGGSFACQEDAKVCPDGSAVGRRGPNCEFAPCPKK